MTLRTQFNGNLEEIRLDIVSMGATVTQQIGKAVRALTSQDPVLAKEVMDNDIKINSMQAKIENECINIMATQQPLARDLRKVVATLKISIYLERVGDLSVDIANQAIRLSGENFIMPLHDIEHMCELVKNMLNIGVTAYASEDSDVALIMAHMDDMVDKQYSDCFYKLQGMMTTNPENIEQATQLLFVYRFIERIGDYCTNVAEEIVYISSGNRVDLN